MSERARLVLVVEDDPLSMELATELLVGANWRVLQASTAEEGIAIARRERPTLVLMDIGLPGMSGLNALRILRADPETADVVVVALSAQAMAGDAEQGITAGFNAYLTKPINTRTMLRTLESLLDGASTS